MIRGIHLNKAEIIVLKIMQMVVTGIYEDFPLDTDWDAIRQELDNQALLPFSYSILRRSYVPEGDFRQEWIGYIFYHISKWYKMLEVQDQLVQLLTQSGYKFVIMKGLANASLYPNPEFRTLGDVDFMVRRDEFNDIYQMMQQNGYKPADNKDELKHHMTLEKDGVIFEMHKRPAGTKRNYSADNQKVIDYFQAGLDQVNIVELEGYAFPVLDPVRNGLMLLMHTAGHMQGGIGIRHLLDWGFYADRYLTDSFWREEFQQMAKDFQVYDFAMIMTRICQKEFGLCKDRNWCKGADEDICDSLLEYMMLQGNFGHKTGVSDAGAKFFTEGLDSEGFFRRLDRSSRYSMPAVNKYPILRPVGWIYQMGRYINRGLHRENAVNSLQEDVGTGRERRKLMKDLGIQEWLKSDRL